MENRNQKIKMDAGKTQWSLLPWGPVEQIVKVYEFGLKKYGKRGSWKDVEPERYIDALFRHIIAWADGEEVDKESGLLHLAHAGWNIITLIWFATQKKDGPWLDCLTWLTEKEKELIIEAVKDL